MHCTFLQIYSTESASSKTLSPGGLPSVADMHLDSDDASDDQEFDNSLDEGSGDGDKPLRIASIDLSTVPQTENLRSGQPVMEVCYR